MAVSGTGKSTIGQRLAVMLGTDLVEGDDYHPIENLNKMSSGGPPTDEDRLPWLRALSRVLDEHRSSGTTTVLTCSALRRTYRDILRGAAPAERTLFTHLYGDMQLLRNRMSVRQHFMPASLLRSQFEALEELGPGECGLKSMWAPPSR